MNKTIFLFLMCFTSLVINAQWTTDTAVNTLVASSVADDMKALGTSDGKTYVVFWKPVATPENYELRLQILDADGNQTLGADGALISNSIPMSTFTVIWNIYIDDNNDLYIGVTGTGGGDPAFVFKFDDSGSSLWNSAGVNIGNGNLVTILPLSNGEAIVSWLSSSGAVMQKYNSSGNAVWPSIQPIVNGSSFTAPANLFEISGGEYIAVFHTLLGGINTNLWSQRYDTDGNNVWANPVQLSDRATAFNRSYKGVQDGDVVYMSYFASSGVRFDSFLQRINPDGTLPWGINGSDFDTNETNYEMETEAAFSNGSSFVWATCTYRDANQSMAGEYVQKFDKVTGARLLTDNAKEVFAIGEEKTHAGSLQLKDDSPLALIVNGVNNGANPVELAITYLDDQGNFVWPEQIREVATFAASKGRIHYTKPINNQSVAVFVENKGNGNQIFAQNFIDGVLGISDFNSSRSRVVYVNPVKSYLHLESEFEIQSITIFNELGMKVGYFIFQEEKTIELALDYLSTGLYFINIETANEIINGLKLIKE